MLKEISCDALISSPIKFKAGLNAVVGANDAHNSIGKSSVLMLIDFAFGGTDFPNKCDDVIRNIGDFKVIVTFEFEKKYAEMWRPQARASCACAEIRRWLLLQLL